MIVYLCHDDPFYIVNNRLCMCAYAHVRGCVCARVRAQASMCVAKEESTTKYTLH